MINEVSRRGTAGALSLHKQRLQILPSPPYTPRIPPSIVLGWKTASVYHCIDARRPAQSTSDQAALVQAIQTGTEAFTGSADLLIKTFSVSITACGIAFVPFISTKAL